MRRLTLAALVLSAIALVGASPASAQSPAVAPRPGTTAADTVPIATSSVNSAPLVAPSGTTLRTAPDAPATATIVKGATMTPLARERGWVRVRIEGWVPEREVVAADSSLRSPLSAADLRADPAGTRGKIVRWEVELLSLQTADPLRRDFAVDEPYLLARGPGRENAIVYLAVPPSLVATAKTMAARPLTHATVTARVRNGRSEPVGVPILDVLSIVKQ